MKSRTTTLLLTLLAGDIAFVLLHAILTATNQIADYPLCSLAKDGGYAEYYQYLKELAIIVALVLIYRRTGAVGYLGWAALFGVILWDDILQFHEQLGQLIATDFGIGRHIGIRGQDFGELLVSSVTGALLLGGIAWLYRRGSVAFRQVSRQLVLLLVGLAFVGVFLDTLHFIYEVNWKFSVLMVTLEDGGEMVVMSSIVWYLFVVYTVKGAAGMSSRQLWSRLRASDWNPTEQSSRPEQSEEARL